MLKFVLSILAVSIHVGPFGEFWMQPFKRIAVPLFFLITSYFLFSGLAGCSCMEVRVAKLEKYIKRNLQLYLFWFIVLWIPSNAERKWFEGGVIKGFYRLSHSFLYGSTFRASWFISACIIAAIVVVTAGRYLRNWQIVLLASVPYAVCCLLTNYAQVPFVAYRTETLRLLFDGSSNSFWVALLWFALGRWLVDSRPVVERIGSGTLAVASLAGFGLLCLENYIVYSHGWAGYQDAFFTLPFACVPLFLLVLRFRLKVPFACQMRVMSVVTYCLHFSLVYIFREMMRAPIGSLELFLLVLAMCWALSLAIMWLEKLPHLRWLRFSH